MSKASREKGARAERALAELLRSRGWHCERNARNGISTCDLDHNIPKLHIECKWQETFKLEDFWNQATSDAPDGSVPVVMFKRSGKRWRAVLYLDDFMDLVEEVHGPSTITK